MPVHGWPRDSSCRILQPLESQIGAMAGNFLLCLQGRIRDRSHWEVLLLRRFQPCWGNNLFIIYILPFFLKGHLITQLKPISLFGWVLQGAWAYWFMHNNCGFWPNFWWLQKLTSWYQKCVEPSRKRNWASMCMLTHKQVDMLCCCFLVSRLFVTPRTAASRPPYPPLASQVCPISCLLPLWHYLRQSLQSKSLDNLVGSLPTQ